MKKLPTIHPLRRWLFERQTTLGEFAKVAGVTQGYLSELITGTKRPRLDIIDRITAATDGAITANDFQRVTSKLQDTHNGTPTRPEEQDRERKVGAAERP